MQTQMGVPTYLNVMTTAKGRLLRQREDLVRQREAMRATISDLTASQAAEGARATHPADAATDLLAAEASLGDLAEVEERIAEVDAALERIERGVYGVCVDCGGPIDPARIKVLPTAVRCLRCQTIREYQERR